MSAAVDPPANWAVVDGALHRELTFADFAEAFAFMGQVAALAEEQDHHPDWSNSWNRVEIRLVSHDVGAITDRDLRLAEAIEALLPA
jgi:4a-hydroxytetrahydrobiopterin dehydratase